MDKKVENSLGIATDLSHLGRILEEAAGKRIRRWIITSAPGESTNTLGLKDRVVKDLDDVSRLYEKLGKPEEAERIRQTAAQVPILPGQPSIDLCLSFPH